MLRAYAWPELQAELEVLRTSGKCIVFTNGVFDLIHPGHLRYLRDARAQGNVLVLGLNSDASVRRNKGEGRPIIPETERTKLLAALEVVDFVTLFDEETPLNLIELVRPNVLVKGGDYQLHEIVGRDEVEADGGKVLTIPFETGFSSTGIIQRILAAHK